MSRLQQWIGGTVVAVLVIVAAGWFVLVSPQKHKVSNFNAQSVAQDQTNSGLRTKLSVLTAQMAAVPTEQAEVAAVTQKIPSDPAMPAYVRALTTIAQQTGVELVSIAPSVPTAISVAAPAVAAAATPSAAATTAPAAAAPAVAPVALQSITVSLSVQGGYFQIQQFTAALQKLARTTVISAVTIAPGPALKKVTQASSAVAPPPWKSLAAAITVGIFMNSSDTFAVPAVPSQTTAATLPGVAAASAPALPSASASN
jgi:Tfp pilus assembly protein PilO